MIYVITHKNFKKVTNDCFYKILHVGNNETSIVDCLRDNLLDNISNKNSQYCELTGIYWIWKNCNDSIVGIVHYRRYFVSFIGKILSKCKYTQKFVHPLKSSNILKYLNKYDVVVAKRSGSNITVYNAYKLYHHLDDLDRLRTVVLEKHPDYIEAFDDIMKEYKISNYNMMVCKKMIFDDYCEWLFSILFELEMKEKIIYEDPYQNRVYGFLAERLLNVWIRKNNLKIKELYTYNSETFKI